MNTRLQYNGVYRNTFTEINSHGILIYSADDIVHDIDIVQVDIHGQFKMTAKLQDGCQNKGF